MTKADLIEEVSRVVEMTRKESEVIVEAIFDSIVRSLRTGDKIEIRGFGSFRTRQRHATGTDIGFLDVDRKRSFVSHRRVNYVLRIGNRTSRTVDAAACFVSERVVGEFE